MKKTVFIIGSSLLLLFTACQKEMSTNDITIYPGNPLNDTIWTRTTPSNGSVNDLVNYFLPQVIIDSFDASKSDVTLSYGDSLSISFPAGSCVGTSANGGTPGVPSGKVQLQILRLKTKGDYIKTFRPTTSNGYLLEAAGGFFIRILSKEGKELALAPGATVKLSFSDIDPVKPNMQAFYGKETYPLPANSVIDTGFTWMRDTDTSWLSTFQRPSTISGNAIINGYTINVKNLRWVAAERYIDSTAKKAKIFAILPPNFTNQNTAVFAVFMNQKTIVNLAPEYSSRSFTASNIPIGSKIRLITISKIGDDFYMGTKDINDLGTTTIFPISPSKMGLTDILTYLNSL